MSVIMKPDVTEQSDIYLPQALIPGVTLQTNRGIELITYLNDNKLETSYRHNADTIYLSTRDLVNSQWTGNLRNVTFRRGGSYFGKLERELKEVGIIK